LGTRPARPEEEGTEEKKGITPVADEEMTVAIAASRALCRFVETKASLLASRANWLLGIEGRHAAPVRSNTVRTQIIARYEQAAEMLGLTRRRPAARRRR
ncbi:MAG: hypothetical protein AAB295_10045, partial [Chloroflexota bacterium]